MPTRSTAAPSGGLARRALATLPVPAAAPVLPPPGGAQSTVGAAVIGRTFTDACSRCTVGPEYEFPVAAYGLDVQSVSTFGGTPTVGPSNNIGRSFVPLLVTDP